MTLLIIDFFGHLSHISQSVSSHPCSFCPIDDTVWMHQRHRYLASMIMNDSNDLKIDQHQPVLQLTSGVGESSDETTGRETTTTVELEFIIVVVVVGICG